MQRVHFIAIGGAAMHNLAIAVSKKGNFLVTGSDDEILEPSRSRLKENGLLPEKNGWFPERIHKNLQAVVIGTHAAADNPELARAKELGLKIYSFPEYLFQQTRSKTRIVVGGSHGKTTITAMILFVLKKLRMDTDYVIGTTTPEFQSLVKLSYESRIAVFEGDEYLTSPIDLRPKFHLYKPHIAVLTGIAWDHINIFPTVENYIEQFRIFVDLMEMQGRLIYFDGDKNLNIISTNLRRDIVPFPYNTPEFEVINSVTYLKTKKSDIPLKIFGEHNLQNLNAARLACKQIGVTDEQFFNIIKDFTGVPNRLEKIFEKDTFVVFKDNSNSPGKIKVALSALKKQYPGRKLIVCLELYTISSLSEIFFHQCEGCLGEADTAYLSVNQTVVEKNKLQNIQPKMLVKTFGGENKVAFINDSESLKQKLSELDFENSVLIFIAKEELLGEKLDVYTGTFLE